MVAQCYQACFCSLNTVFIVKLNSNSILNHDFTIKTGFNFQLYSQNQLQSQVFLNNRDVQIIVNFLDYQVNAWMYQLTFMLMNCGT